MSVCAFDKGNECSALNEKNCENCSFCKTKEELIRGREKAAKRLEKLPPTLRKILIRRYHKKKGVSDEW